MNTTIQAAFLDRDGTIGGTGGFIHPRDFVLYPFAAEAIRRLQAAGVKVFGFTNQNRISKGEATEAEFRDQFAQFGFDGAYICPHPTDADCECRKPSPGMILQAAREYGLDLSRCAVVGDWGNVDMAAAHRAGTLKVLVRTGYGEASLTQYRHTWAEAEPDYVAADLADAVDWLLAWRGAERAGG